MPTVINVVIWLSIIPLFALFVWVLYGHFSRHNDIVEVHYAPECNKDKPYREISIPTSEISMLAPSDSEVRYQHWYTQGDMTFVRIPMSLLESWQPPRQGVQPTDHLIDEPPLVLALALEPLTAPAATPITEAVAKEGIVPSVPVFPSPTPNEKEDLSDSPITVNSREQVKTEAEDFPFPETHAMTAVDHVSLKDGADTPKLAELDTIIIETRDMDEGEGLVDRPPAMTVAHRKGDADTPELANSSSFETTFIDDSIRPTSDVEQESLDPVNDDSVRLETVSDMSVSVQTEDMALDTVHTDGELSREEGDEEEFLYPGGEKEEDGIDEWEQMARYLENDLKTASEDAAEIPVQEIYVPSPLKPMFAHRPGNQSAPISPCPSPLAIPRPASVTGSPMRESFAVESMSDALEDLADPMSTLPSEQDGRASPADIGEDTLDASFQYPSLTQTPFPSPTETDHPTQESSASPTRGRGNDESGISDIASNVDEYESLMQSPSPAALSLEDRPLALRSDAPHTAERPNWANCPDDGNPGPGPRSGQLSQMATSSASTENGRGVSNKVAAQIRMSKTERRRRKQGRGP